MGEEALPLWGLYGCNDLLRRVTVKINHLISVK